MNKTKALKIVCGLVCLLLLVIQVWSMSRWNEARGVYDDVCYLRQAHLFQRFGIAGFDTDISRDDDNYLVSKLREIGFPLANDKLNAPCHNAMPKTKKVVLQYPPGTGFMLSLFPEGRQVIPLFASATVIMFGFALLGILYARTTLSILSTTAFGCLAIYIMINPVKASYSMAPTMVICAIAGYLTARLFVGKHDNRIWLTILLGFLLGLSVNFRLPNLFLSAGYFLFFFVAFLSRRKSEIAVRGCCFGVAFVVGLAPTLVANAINAGSPFATTYGGEDVSPPGFSLNIILMYVADRQFVLLLALAGASLAYLLHTGKDAGARTVALVTAANLVGNLAFFFTHPLVTPYYTVPIAMLSLWSLSFAFLIRPAQAASLPDRSIRDHDREPAESARIQKRIFP